MLWEYIARQDNLLLFQIAATVVAVAIYLAARHLCNKSIDRRVQSRRSYHPRRVASTRRTVNLIAIAFLLTILAAVWSINLRSLALASGAILATLGVAFFAQWSVLCNVTTSVIMFWRFPIRIGDRIRVLTEHPVSGTVTNMTPFFIVLRDEDSNTITIPNAVSLQHAFVIYADEGST